MHRRATSVTCREQAGAFRTLECELNVSLFQSLCISTPLCCTLLRLWGLCVAWGFLFWINKGHRFVRLSCICRATPNVDAKNKQKTKHAVLNMMVCYSIRYGNSECPAFVRWLTHVTDRTSWLWRSWLTTPVFTRFCIPGVDS